MITRFEATVALNKEKCVHQDGENGIFIDSVKVVDFTDIDKKVIELKAEYDNDYSRKREAEYPSIQDCIHAILDDDLTALQEKRQAVKTKYPKS